MKRKRGVCVFCKQYGLTKEHIWSNWLTNILPPQNEIKNRTIIRELMNWNARELHFVHEHKKIRPVRPTQQKIRKVCKNCNSGWMASLVSKAKPYIEGRILGSSSEIDAHGQEVVSAWITLACMMAEFTDPQSAGIADIDFIKMHKSGQALDNWVIGLANYSGEAWHPTNYGHYGCGFVIAKPMDSTIQTTPDKLQLSTYTLDNIAIHAFSSTELSVVSSFRDKLASRGFSQIWPIIHDCVDFDAFSMLHDNDLNMICRDVTFLPDRMF